MVLYNSIFKSAKLKLADKKCKIIYDTYRNYMIYLNHLKGRETIMYIFYDLIGFKKKSLFEKLKLSGSLLLEQHFPMKIIRDFRIKALDLDGIITFVVI